MMANCSFKTEHEQSHLQASLTHAGVSQNDNKEISRAVFFKKKLGEGEIGPDFACPK